MRNCVVLLGTCAVLLGACDDPVAPRGTREAAPTSVHPAAQEAGGVDITVSILPGLERRFAVDINNRGEVVGSCEDRDFYPHVGAPPSGAAAVAFVSSPAGGVRELGTLGGAWSCAAAINDLGQVVGYSQTAAGAVRAFVWTAEGGMRDLGTLLGGAESRALDVNNRGEVVGWSATAEGRRQAVLWSPAGYIHDLGSPPPTAGFVPGNSIAYAINDLSQVVGTVFKAGGPPDVAQVAPFRWTAAEGMQLFGQLVRSVDALFYLLDVNDRGEAVGVQYAFGDATTLFVEPSGERRRGAYIRCGLTGVGALTGINESGQVAGYCGTNGPEGFFAFVILEGGVSIRLPLLPGQEGPFRLRPALAFGINDRGEVVGAIGDSSVIWRVGAAPSEVLLVGRQSGKCLDVFAASREPGAEVIIWPCHGDANQRWALPPAGTPGEVRVYAGEGTPLCLDVSGGGNDWDPIIVSGCNGGASQQWTLTAAGELRGLNGKCLDVAAESTADAAPLILYTCHGGANQQWDPRAAGATSLTSLSAAPQQGSW